MLKQRTQIEVGKTDDENTDMLEVDQISGDVGLIAMYDINNAMNTAMQDMKVDLTNWKKLKWQ